MSVSLRELADLVGGELQGDGDVRIERAAPIADAKAGDITFVADEKLEAQVATTQASAVIVRHDFPDQAKPLIRVAEPFESLLVMASRLHPPKPRARIGVHPRACVDPTATIGSDSNVFQFATVGANSTLGDRVDVGAGTHVGDHCRIGDDVVLDPNVTIMDGTIIGNRSIIHGGAVIGCDGFGYRQRNGHHEKIPQMGHVEICDDVEIGAATAIDRATIGATRIGRGTKIDNQVMVGHNCQIGEHCLIISQVGIAGSCTVGDWVIMAGQVGIVDHVDIGDQAVLGAQAGVTKDVRAGETVLGSPAAPARDAKRMLMAMSRLPEFKIRLRTLENRLDALEKRPEEPPS